VTLASVDLERDTNRVWVLPLIVESSQLVHLRKDNERDQRRWREREETTVKKTCTQSGGVVHSSGRKCLDCLLFIYPSLHSARLSS
jgi:hypothetical protein